MVRVIGQRVRELRQERGLSQAELARRAGLTGSQVSRLENDERPGVQAVAVGQIAAVLNTTSDYLMGLTADPFRQPPVDWRTDPAHLVRVQRLIERLMQLPEEQQDRIMDAVLTLLAVSEVVDGEGT